MYEVVGVAESGDEYVVTGTAHDCQWLKIVDNGGVEGWLSANPDIVTFDSQCDTIPEADIPPIPTAAFTPTPETGGMGTITFINMTPDRGASVHFRTCCEHFEISTEPGETGSIQLPPDEYGWYVFSISCRRDMPQLFLKSGMQVIVKLIPDPTQPCTSYIEGGIIE